MSNENIRTPPFSDKSPTVKFSLNEQSEKSDSSTLETENKKEITRKKHRKAIPVSPFPEKKTLTRPSVARKEGRECVKGNRFHLFAVTFLGYLTLLIMGILPLIVHAILHYPAVNNYLKEVWVLFPQTAELIVNIILLFGAVLLAAGLKGARMKMYWRKSLKIPNENPTSMWSFCTPKKIFRCGKMFLLLFAIRLSFAVLLLSPGALLVTLGFSRFRSAGIYSVVIILFSTGVAALAMGLLFYGFLTERYILSWYFFTEKDGSAVGAVRASAVIMEGQCWRALRLKLSYIPLFITCILIFPLIYAVPAYGQARACFCRNAMNAKGLRPQRKIFKNNVDVS